MSIKLVVSIAAPVKTDQLLDLAKKAGATGATVLPHGRGEGMFKQRGVMGLELIAQRDVLLFLVPESISNQLLDELSKAGGFDERAGTGVAFQLDVESVRGLRGDFSDL